MVILLKTNINKFYVTGSCIFITRKVAVTYSNYPRKQITIISVTSVEYNNIEFEMFVNAPIVCFKYILELGSILQSGDKEKVKLKG